MAQSSPWWEMDDDIPTKPTRNRITARRQPRPGTAPPKPYPRPAPPNVKPAPYTSYWEAEQAANEQSARAQEMADRAQQARDTVQNRASMEKRPLPMPPARSPIDAILQRKKAPRKSDTTKRK